RCDNFKSQAKCKRLTSINTYHTINQ
ncbi:MAG: hypothetical protein JWR75_1710, partial [Devosia sp.]|nr:hypothetical protein [Devosia sp.]